MLESPQHNLGYTIIYQGRRGWQTSLLTLPWSFLSSPHFSQLCPPFSPTREFFSHLWTERATRDLKNHLFIKWSHVHIAQMRRTLHTLEKERAQWPPVEDHELAWGAAGHLKNKHIDCMICQRQQMVNDTSFVTHESATDLQKWDTPKFIWLWSTCLKMDLKV